MFQYFFLALLAVASAQSYPSVCQCPQNRVAFSSYMMQETRITNESLVVYDKILVNVGSGYNEQTGTFTAPVAGVYSFQMSILADQGKDLWLSLYKNSEYVISAYAGHGKDDDYASGGNSVLLHLDANDAVYQILVSNKTFYASDNDQYNSFTGYLLYAD